MNFSESLADSEYKRSFYIAKRTEVGPVACSPEEIVEEHIQLLLRFPACIMVCASQKRDRAFYKAKLTPEFEHVYIAARSNGTHDQSSRISPL